MPSRDGGMVTAEIAVAMPAVVMLLAAVGLSGAAVVTKVQCVDAARAGARAASRGDPAGQVTAAARAVGPPDAAIAVRVGTGEVMVHCAAPVTGLGRLGLPGLVVAGRATALVEQQP